MNNSDPTELEDIVSKAKKGDKEAFSVLYTSYFNPLYKYIYFRVGSKNDAEDLLQDVFVKAYVSFPRYSYSGTSPLAYFYTIARNAIIDYRRKNKIMVSESDEDESHLIPDEADTPEEEAMKLEDKEMIRKKIALLPEGEQDVITLRFINELSTKEVAIILEKTEEAIRQLQSRGLKRLRKHILHE